MFVNRLKCFLCKFNSVFGQLNDKRTNRDTTKRNIFEKNDYHKKVIETYTESRVTNSENTSRTPRSCGIIHHVIDQKVEGSNLATAKIIF